MPRVVVGSALARWLDSATGHDSSVKQGERSFTAQGATLRQLLEDLFAQAPRLRDYVVDEHFHVRHHVVIFLDGAAVTDRRELQTPTAECREVYLLQALSGG